MFQNQQVVQNNDTISGKPLMLKEKAGDKISFGILLGLVFLLPIFFVPFPSFAFLFSKSILIYLAVILMSIMWIVARLKDGQFSITKNPILILAVCIPLVYLVSSLISGAISTSFIGQGFEVGTFGFIFALFLLIFLASSILNSKKKIYYVFFTFILSFFLLSVIQLLRLFIGPEFLSFGVLEQPTSNLIGKWNELAIFYGLTAVISLVTIEFISHSKLVKTLAFIILAISLFFIALVNFSTVWIVLGVFAFLLVSFIISSNKFLKKPSGFKGKKFPIFSFLVILISLTFIIGSNNIGGSLSTTFGISSTEVRPSFQGTLDIAQGTLKTGSAFLGAGPNRFVSQWLMYKPAGVNETIFWNTDFTSGVSFLMTSLITVGLIGFLLWIVFLGMLFYVGFRAIFTLTEDRADNYLLPITFLATVYLWLFSIIYVPSNVIIALTFVFTGTFIALLIQNGVIKIRKVSFVNNQRADFVLVLVLIFLVLVSVVGGYTISQKFIASAYSQKGLLELNKEGANLSETEKNIIKAINISDNDSYYRFLSEIELVKLQGLLSQKDISKEELQSQFQTILGNAVGYARKSVEIDKTNYQNWLSLGRVYETVILFGVQGAYDQAVDSYIRAINLNPKSPSLMFTLGVLEYNNKNYENAMMVLERSVILKPTYSNAKYFLGLTYYNLGRTKDAIPQFEDLTVLNPESEEVKTILNNLKKGNSPFRGLKGVGSTQSSVEETKSKDVTEE